MKLFLDTSVLLAAGGSASGASREVFDRSELNGWTLITVPWVLEEVERNLMKMPLLAAQNWRELRLRLIPQKNVLTFPHAVVSQKRKDRPVLASAFAHAEILLTLDHVDFLGFLGKQFYGLSIEEPGEFLHRVRAAGMLR